MFKKLRNRFLLLNLSIISVMMLIAFTSIYLITYNNVNAGIDMEMRKLSDNGRKPNENPAQPHGDFNAQPAPERSVSFTIETDSQWNKTVVTSPFEMDNSFYENMKKAAQSHNADTGKLKQDGYYWAFMVKPVPDGYRLVFLEITSRQGILTNLIYTFAAVAVVMLVFIFLISRFFANRSIKPVKVAFEKQEQFIADASHELKTPLSIINTNVDVLLSNAEDSIGRQSKWLYYIKSEAERMTKLTNDLLYLTKINYSDAKLVYSDFNLSEAVENVILTMEAAFFEKNISLSYNIEPGLKAHGSREQIMQVAMILLDNAMKYTSSGGLVDIALKRSHNAGTLTVSNTGEGILEENIGKVFDRFYRTDKSRARKSGGYGLGLAIAKAIVEQHGGKISVRSVPNEKTVFSVEL